jgi:hypothetical protein
MVGDPDIEAGRDDRITRPESGVTAADHGPREVDAADTGVTADDAAAAGRRQRILVIDAGEGDLDRHLARVELRLVHGDEAGSRDTFLFFDQISLEGTHAHSIRWIGLWKKLSPHERALIIDIKSDNATLLAQPLAGPSERISTTATGQRGRLYRFPGCNPMCSAPSVMVPRNPVLPFNSVLHRDFIRFVA